MNVCVLSQVGGVLTKAKGAIPVQLPSMPAMPNIPIPGLNKSQNAETVADAAAAAASQDYSQVSYFEQIHDIFLYTHSHIYVYIQGVKNTLT